MKISDAEVTDLSKILDLQKLAYQSEAALYNDWTLPALLQSLESITLEFHTGKIIKATLEQTTIGSVRASCTNGKCEIGKLIVHPDYQRKGIGSQLLQYIENAFPDALRYELFTGSISRSNIRLYQKHGYSLGRYKAMSDTVSIVYLEKYHNR